MELLGHKWIRDVGKTSMVLRELVLVIVATGDFGVAGPKPDGDKAYDELDSTFGFSPKSKVARLKGSFAGLIGAMRPSPQVEMYIGTRPRYSAATAVSSGQKLSDAAE